MKQTVLVLFLLFLLAVGCFLSILYIQTSADQLMEDLNQLEALISTQEWQSALLLLTEFQEKWGKISHRWQILIDHDDIRDIEIGLTDLETALLQQDVKEAQKEVRGLRYFVSHVPKNEKIAISNIL